MGGVREFAWSMYISNIRKELNMAKKKGIPGLSFSWKRALGITGVKQKVAKKTGIPTTKAGRQKKVGKILGIK